MDAGRRLLGLVSVGAISSDESFGFGDLESYRRELTGYCYRMLASLHDAEDAVQDTLIRAWRGLARFDEDRGGVRPWLYRIATNVCLDMLKGRRRRALPIELAPRGAGEFMMGDPRPEATWVQPIPDALLVSDDGDPVVVAIARETVRLAFIAALQHLAPRQRAVLILRDVLSWRASEVAELLETSEDAVNGALKRARAAIARADLEIEPPDSAEVERELLDRYVDAFERYDVDALVGLLHEDAIVAMPPFELWLQGLADIRTFLAAMRDEGGRDRLLAIRANGCPAVAVYRPGRAGALEPYAIMVLEVAGDRITAIHAFLDTSLFSAFGLSSGDQFSPPAQL
ncbi:MAG: sigma-70 family RNA polymerase sigma factor [Solirubrobacteraceae bacterium]